MKQEQVFIKAYEIKLKKDQKAKNLIKLLANSLSL